MPLTSDKTALLDKINGLTAARRHGRPSRHRLGLVHAVAELDLAVAVEPRRRPTAPTDLQKIAILMTDGEYNTQYDSNGIDGRSERDAVLAGGQRLLDRQARALCTAMKAKGIIVYTVGFDLGGNQTAIDTLTQCATDPTKFYNADDGEQLKQAFRDIALKLSSLYLSK